MVLNDTGIVNTVLRFFGAEGFNWFGSTKTAMIAVVIVSIWRDLDITWLFLFPVTERSQIIDRGR